jgi:hypothetical protein
MKTIHADPEIIVFTTEDLTRPHADLNVDVEVRDENYVWALTWSSSASCQSR